MKYDVKVPAVGESITEATIGSWMKQNGETVKRNDVLMLLETDKASVEVVAEQDGVLQIKTEAGQTIPIGSVVAVIDSEGKASVASATASAPAGASKSSEKSGPAPAPSPSVEARASQGSLHPDLKNHLSPAVAKITAERGIDPSSVQGTGRDGRLTKADVMSASAPAPAKESKAPVQAPALRGPSKQGDEKRVAMTTIRKKTAERLKQAQNTAAILTTFNEVDMSKAMELRNKYKDKFKEKYGTSLGFMGIFVKAAIEALKDWPAINASIDGNDIVYKNFYNIGVAVGTEKGLIVPVIKDSDQLTVAGVELAIKNFALKARDGKISIDDLSGGTFTISNGGVFGSLMSTPILTPPQVAILGMHKVEDRPVAINGKVEIRPMMYLALSYDHRIVDGKEAVSFLVRIKECVEDPERLVLEI
ncbi:MAG: 2-oxoglutarate dehydrogenase complex dihydrolipoyllysine-residue succinyltransferase [Pseudobdellovibrionaceae bacterium]